MAIQIPGLRRGSEEYLGSGCRRHTMWDQLLSNGTALQPWRYFSIKSVLFLFAIFAKNYEQAKCIMQGCSVSNVNLRLIVPGGFRVHFLHRYRRNLYFISVLCSYSTQLSADKTEGSPGVSSQIFRPREAGLQGPKPQGHYRLTRDFFPPFFFFSTASLHPYFTYGVQLAVTASRTTSL